MTQLERRRLEEIAVQNIPWNSCVATVGTPLEPTAVDISHNVVEEKFDYPVMSNGWVQKEISVPAARPCWEAPSCAVAERQPVNGVSEAYVHGGEHPVHAPDRGFVGAVSVPLAAQPANGMVVEEIRPMQDMDQADHHHQEHHHDHMASTEDPAPFFGVLSPLSPIREVAETGSTPRAELPCADAYSVQEHPHCGDYIYPEGHMDMHGPQVMDPEIKTPEALEGCPPSMQTSRQRYLQIRDKFLSR